MKNKTPHKDTSPQSAGGRAKAAKIRAEYKKNPNICKNCNAPILPKPTQKLAEVRKKKFCNHKCSASFNNKFREPKKRKDRICHKCNNIFHADSVRKYCKKCWKTILYATGNKRKCDISRAAIVSNARTIMGKRKRSCLVCKYSTHVETCHIKPVSSFSAEALIKEINKLNNLVYLCPNHHWEFDKGLLNL